MPTEPLSDALGWSGDRDRPPRVGQRGRRGRGLLVIGSVLVAVALLAALVVSVALLHMPLPGLGLGPRPTPTAMPTPTATPVEQLLYQDPLDGTSGRNWPNNTQCSQMSDGYHVTANTICLLNTRIPVPNDVNISADVRQIAGPTDQASSYGLAFRRSGPKNFYTFEIDSGSHWYFYKAADSQFSLLAGSTPSPAIHTGLNASNTLLVRVFGAHFTFFVNGQQVGSAADTSFTAGAAGLDGNDGIEVVYTNFKLTKTVG
jgi:hypothetical protein